MASGDADKWSLRPKEFLAEADIDFRLGRDNNVFNILPESKEVILVSGKYLNYDKLLIATGSDIWFPPVKGLEMKRGNFTIKNVYPLRTAKHQESIKKAVEAGAKKNSDYWCFIYWN